MSVVSCFIPLWPRLSFKGHCAGLALDWTWINAYAMYRYNWQACLKAVARLWNISASQVQWNDDRAALSSSFCNRKSSESFIFLVIFHLARFDRATSSIAEGFRMDLHRVNHLLGLIKKTPSESETPLRDHSHMMPAKKISYRNSLEAILRIVWESKKMHSNEVEHVCQLLRTTASFPLLKYFVIAYVTNCVHRWHYLLIWWL